MRVQQSQSTIKPPEWDTTSSSVVVYHNFNVTVQEATGDMPKLYNYTQEVYTKEEYAQHCIDASLARINYAEAAILNLMDKGLITNGSLPQ